MELNCYLLGDDKYDPFSVKVSSDIKVQGLIAEILQIHEQHTGTSLINVCLYRIDVAPEDLPNLDASSEASNCLKRMHSVKVYWPGPESLDDSRVHILITGDVVRAESEPQTGPKSKVQVSNLIERFQQSRTKYRNTLAEASASTAARPSTFAQLQQGEGYVLNGRPLERTGPPVLLYHPVFGNFLSNLQASEPLPPQFYNAILDYFWISQDTFRAETGSNSHGKLQGDTTRQSLKDLFGELWMVSQPGATPDAVSIGPGGDTLLFIETQNEIGTGGSDPSIKATQSYSRFWNESELLNRCCCPSILIAIAGPWMCVLGAVFLDRPVVQPLTDYLWVGANPSKPRNIGYIARVFHCVLEAQRELGIYYANLTSRASPTGTCDISALFFPYPTHFIGNEGEQVEFSYITYLKQASLEAVSHQSLSESQFARDKLVFLAELHTSSLPKPIVVKFVHSYSVAAHKLLAQVDLAPKLLYDGIVGETHSLGPDYRMIVMEYVTGVDLGHYSGPRLPSSVSEDIDRALSLLHDAGFVFADLRPPNVMIVKNEDGMVTGAKLIDFDWCGTHQEGQYPFDMNTSITWASGAGPGALLDKGHDTEMRKRLLV